MNMFGGLTGVPCSEEVTIFLCGPNRTCDHVFDKWENLYDGDRVSGETTVCSKCGETAFGLSLWSD